MITSSRCKPLTIMLVFFVSLFSMLQMMTKSIYGQESLYQCVSVRLRNPIYLRTNSSGNIISSRVSITFVVNGESQLSNNGYRVSYRYTNQALNLNIGWDSIDLVFVPDPDNPGTDYMAATAVIEVDRLGRWEYMLETREEIPGIGRRNITGEACNNGFDVQLDPGTGVTTENCDAGLLETHFECYRQSSPLLNGSYEWVSGAGCQGGGLINESLCSGGLVVNSPEDQIYTSMLSPDEAYYCIPCITEEEVEVQASYGEPCDIDLTLPCEQEMQGSPHRMECREAPSGDLGNICLPAPGTVQEGGPCYSTVDCAPDNFRGDGVFIPEERVPLVCQKEENELTGVCATTSDPESPNRCTPGNNEICEELLDDDTAYCNSAGYCASGENTGDIDDSNNPATNIPISGLTNQFGIRNCPGAVPSEGDPEQYAFDVNNSVGATLEDFNNCTNCLENGGTWTAIGCIVTTPEGIFTSLIRIGLGVMGGVALLRMIHLGFLYQVGNEEKIREAGQGVFATLAAIILVLFSVVILQIIGVNVLDVVPPGFFGV